ncbi:kelch repeat protein [Striga asiatica]|uniref:Kelch repeat protein n=1 Tax=Striga asiatica TaxID=4170 RepID=A0A5A7RDD9_STRAF|nr:kelch repeat protein [Striga asiatica]
MDSRQAAPNTTTSLAFRRHLNHLRKTMPHPIRLHPPPPSRRIPYLHRNFQQKASSEEIVRTGPKLSFMAASERRTMKKKSTKYLIRSPMNSVDDQGQHLGRDGISDSVATEIKGAAKVKIRFPLSNFTSRWMLVVLGRVRAGHASVSIGTKVYVLGGIGDKQYFNDIWVLDINTSFWARLNVTCQKSQGRF